MRVRVGGRAEGVGGKTTMARETAAQDWAGVAEELRSVERCRHYVKCIGASPASAESVMD